MPRTINELVENIAKRAGELAELPMDSLRALYPEATDTRAELVRLCKQSGYSRSHLIATILFEDYSVEYDVEIADLV